MAYRRHQFQRAKGRARRYLRWLRASDPQSVTPRSVARWAVDRTPCSCWMCGNPRRFTGEVTRQELQAGRRCAAQDAETVAALNRAGMSVAG